jgi:hypothetical protein
VNFVVVHNKPHDVVACGRRPLGGLRETASRFANIEISDDVRDTKFRLARRPNGREACRHARQRPKSDCRNQQPERNPDNRGASDGHDFTPWAWVIFR